MGRNIRQTYKVAKPSYWDKDGVFETTRCVKQMFMNSILAKYRKARSSNKLKESQSYWDE
jgi:hypothetical protein